MTFIKICDKEIIENVNDGLKLNVIANKGVNTSPDFNIKTTNLNRDEKTKILGKHFFNGGYGGITFKIDVEIPENDLYAGEKVCKVIHDWIKNMKPLFVKTEAMDVPDGKYIITGNKDRKQSYRGYSTWSLEFTTYNPLTTVIFANDNMTIADAKKKYKQKVKKSKSLNKQLKKCQVKNMKINKRNTCCFHLNSKLLKLGLISSKQWKKLTKAKKTNMYTKTTAEALKRFQSTENSFLKGMTSITKKKFKKLKVNGKMDKETLKALLEH